MNKPSEKVLTLCFQARSAWDQGQTELAREFIEIAHAIVTKWELRDTIAGKEFEATVRKINDRKINDLAGMI